MNLVWDCALTKCRRSFLHSEIKWLENVSPGVVFDREKEILMEEKKGVIPSEEQRENMQQEFGKPTFLRGKIMHEASLCIYHILCFYEKKVTINNLLTFLLIES